MFNHVKSEACVFSLLPKSFCFGLLANWHRLTLFSEHFPQSLS
ncbi:hypothetical protein D024_1165 [Vibrio parahaemolyticus 3259]|nr:hypothetical protein D024_1228 [Vibrio parahaemolyticus 3259]EQM12783.1 hypothetical protein D024_1165 [Vibrio parahaemolyticus 3259]ETJ84711.1 hypothetical protein D041_5149 [Vibrio parahaemolyticus EKP-008]